MRSGGSYVKDKSGGEPTLVERTKQPARSGPRNDKGELLDDRGEARQDDTKKMSRSKPDKKNDQSDVSSGNSKEDKKS